MLRRLQTVDGKNIDVMNVAGVELVRGMVVQKDLANKKAILPQSSKGLFFVDRDVQPTGLMAYEGDISEYDERLDIVPANTRFQMEKMLPGERYATDQIAEDLTIGDFLEANTDGTLKKAEADTNLVYGGVYNDNGHKLGIVEVQ